MATQATSRKAKAQPATAAEPNERPLKEIFAARDQFARRGEIELMGTLIFAFVEQGGKAGTIEFRQAGPMLARLTTGPEEGALVLMEKWQGLPALVRVTNELCDFCRCECVECKGQKQVRCGHKGCGGAGEIITQWQPCPDCQDRGKRERTCQCGGRGEIPAEKHQCPNCKGTKIEPCPHCKATGRMSSGQVDSQPCGACLGNGRRLDFVEQDWKTFSTGQLEGYTVLGPILGMTLLNPPGEELGITSLECVADYDGNFPVLMIEKPDYKDGRAYLYGGFIRKTQ
jgi:hypothetical protein